MNKKIMMISAAAFLLFCVFLILAGEYYNKEIPSVETNIDYYLAKQSFNQQERNNVETFLLNLKDADFKIDKNKQLAKKYLIMIKDEISKYQETMGVAKKYLTSLTKIEPNSDDNTIALQYFKPILNNKYLEIQGAFSITSISLIQTSLSSITETDIQAFLLKQDSKGIKIMLSGDIQFDYTDLTIKLGENTEFAGFVKENADTFSLKAIDSSKPISFNDIAYNAEEISVTTLSNGRERLEIIMPSGAQNSVEISGKKIDFEYLPSLEQGDQTQLRKLVVTQSALGIESVESTNLLMKSDNINGFSKENAKLLFSRSFGHYFLI